MAQREIEKNKGAYIYQKNGLVKPTQPVAVDVAPGIKKSIICQF